MNNLLHFMGVFYINAFMLDKINVCRGFNKVFESYETFSLFFSVMAAVGE